jgi:hypothetical protein
MKMPFGKYKGQELTEIPRVYLHWLRSQEWVGSWLAKAVDEALGVVVSKRPQEPWRPSAREPWEDSTGWPWGKDEGG